MAQKLILAVTPGDPQGIGPEIVWKAIQRHSKFFKNFALLCVGAEKPFKKLGAPIIEVDSSGFEYPDSKKPFVWLLPAPTKVENNAFLPGYQSGWSLETATRLVQIGIAQALVTGPISKERLQRGGYPYSGHTDFLADLCGKNDITQELPPAVSPEVTMMLANDQLRISLVTTHISLKDVPSRLTAQALQRAVLHTADHLRNSLGIKNPRIAVAALNPHAGEEGLFGREEIEVITPELLNLKKQARGKFKIFGPLPADTLFAKHILAPKKERYDAVVCMYHDQGLIPVKLLDFPHTVNVTLGLPIIRTSVDHGTGFDIAGKDMADPSSFISAVQLASEMISKKSGSRRS
ncbi:MAG: 4-hydroxythreonine-4-phosphate dehydrogenase PdxA [Methylotenera sp.]|nr:4-hydroxythreonine-4-phosphate dehydrogenase PdxA [Oligoflexia bacterium]